MSEPIPPEPSPPEPPPGGDRSDDRSDDRSGDRSGDRSAPVAAGLILAAVALGFAFAPTVVAWADGIRPGLGFPAAVVLAVLLGGGFVAVFWLRGRARRR